MAFTFRLMDTRSGCDFTLESDGLFPCFTKGFALEDVPGASPLLKAPLVASETKALRELLACSGR